MSLSTTDLLGVGRSFRQALEVEAAHRQIPLSQFSVLKAVQSVVDTASRKDKTPNQATLKAAAKAWCDQLEQEKE